MTVIYRMLAPSQMNANIGFKYTYNVILALFI
jgi:hypothetical protein